MKIGSIVLEARQDIIDMQQTLEDLGGDNSKRQAVSNSSLALPANR